MPLWGIHSSGALAHTQSPISDKTHDPASRPTLEDCGKPWLVNDAGSEGKWLQVLVVRALFFLLLRPSPSVRTRVGTEASLDDTIPN